MHELLAGLVSIEFRCIELLDLCRGLFFVVGLHHMLAVHYRLSVYNRRIKLRGVLGGDILSLERLGMH